MNDALQAFHRRAEQAELWLQGCSPAWDTVRTAAVSLLLSLCFFSPKFQLWDFSLEGAYETTRARTFLAQCEDPFAPALEPAMQWRLLPPLVCHGLHLPAPWSLAVPWVGCVAFLASVHTVLRRRGFTRRDALLATALLSTTSAVLVPTMWLGMNDAWAWTALLFVAFGRTGWSVLLPGLLGPWVDERFVIGLPLACGLRVCLSPSLEDHGSATLRSYLRVLGGAGLTLIPYAGLRLALGAQTGFDPSERFLSKHLGEFLTWVPWAPLGAWMALRAGWLAALYGALGLRRHCSSLVPWLALGTLAIMVPLAADLSRSAAIVFPLMLAGLDLFRRREPRRLAPWLAFLLAANLVLPALHVVHTKVDVISPLPLELYRLVRKN